MNKSEIHAGYEFEEGMFARVRSWVDLVPWIRLSRVLRLLASPTYVGMVAIAWGITQVLGWLWLGLGSAGDRSSGFDLQTLQLVIAGVVESPVRSLGFGLLVGLIWLPVLQLVSRAGASLTATVKLAPVGVSGRIIRSRWWQSCLVVVGPLLCVSGAAAFVFLVRLPGLMIPGEPLSIFTGWLIGLGALPIGILGFGALFAIPLGMVAMVCEPDPDAIDSTSRGYEYLYRRPLSMLWYGLVSVGLVLAARALLGGVAGVATFFAAAIISMVSNDVIQLAAARSVITTVLTSWCITLSFGLLGGVYLLLRRDAGGQEVEDFWVPPSEPSPTLPELPEKAYQL